MDSILVKGYAKVNLFLDVLGEVDGYHDLDSIVVTINLYDEILLKKRNDNLVTLSQADSKYKVLDGIENNAVKTAKAFMKKFNTSGVDIFVNKNIPIGSGLGGSSADISAVIKGMAKLYNINCDLKPLADSLGSDSGYLLSGGYARMQGRGEKVESLDLTNKLYMVIITASGGVNTGTCFKLCDQFNQKVIPNGVDNLIKKLKDNTFQREDFYNALYLPATKINSEVEEIYKDLQEFSPRGLSMSGSGGSVFAIFDSKNESQRVFEKLKDKYKDIVITESLSVFELE